MLLAANADMQILILTGYAEKHSNRRAGGEARCHQLPVQTGRYRQHSARLPTPPPVRVVAVAENPLSVDRLEWEHIQRVLAEHEQNISATARALGMHRCTWQRKLAKRPVAR